MNQEENKNLTFKNLDLKIKDSPLLTQHIKQLKKELKSKKILFFPYFWVSDEWFVPDGHTGIAVPFYLVNPKLKQLHKFHKMCTEGSTTNSIMKYLRHETAHAMDNAFGLRKSKKRQTLFGLSSKPYPESYTPSLYSKKYVSNIGEGYAQAHPDEDWAETFSVWLDPLSNWKQKYKNTPALLKLNLLNNLMKPLQKNLNFKNTTECPYNFSKKSITIKKYYELKRKDLNKRNQLFSPVLKEIFSNSKKSTHLLATSFIKKEKNTLIQNFSKQSKAPLYISKLLIDEIEQACFQQNLKLIEPKAITHKKLICLLNLNFSRYTSRGRPSILL